MSHLIHVVALKNRMNAVGISCPIKQHDALGEAYIRAGLRALYAKYGGIWSPEFEKDFWFQLEKWNNVSPIPAQQIQFTLNARLNLLRANMLKDGSPNCSLQYTTEVDADGQKVDIAKLPDFDVLVDYLVNELGAGDE